MRRAMLGLGVLLCGLGVAVLAPSCNGDTTPEVEKRAAAVVVNSWQFVGATGFKANPSNPNSYLSGTVLDVEQVPGTFTYRLVAAPGGGFQYSCRREMGSDQRHPVAGGERPNDRSRPGVLIAENEAEQYQPDPGRVR